MYVIYLLAKSREGVSFVASILLSERWIIP